jgi:hypothetical protein
MDAVHLFEMLIALLFAVIALHELERDLDLEELTALSAKAT